MGIAALSQRIQTTGPNVSTQLDEAFMSTQDPATALAERILGLLYR